MMISRNKSMKELETEWYKLIVKYRVAVDSVSKRVLMQNRFDEIEFNENKTRFETEAKGLETA